MFGTSNPYQAVVQALDEAISACERASDAMHGIPYSKGGGDFGSDTYYAKQVLERARTCASRWQDSYDYHLQGGGRTEFLINPSSLVLKNNSIFAI